MQFSSSSSLLGSISLDISPIFPHSSIRSLEWSSDYYDGSFSAHRLILVFPWGFLWFISSLCPPCPTPNYFCVIFLSNPNSFTDSNVTCTWQTPKFICSVQFSRSVVSNSLRPHELQHARLPVHHQLPEFTQTQIHRVGDAIQPSHPLSSPSPPAPNPSQH